MAKCNVVKQVGYSTTFLMKCKKMVSWKDLDKHIKDHKKEK